MPWQLRAIPGSLDRWGLLEKNRHVKSGGGIRRVGYINGPMVMGEKPRRKAGTRTESLKFLAKMLRF